MTFNIDESNIQQVIAQSLEDAAFKASAEQFNQIAEKIDRSFPGIIALLINQTKEYWKAEASGVSTGWGERYAAAIQSDENSVYVDENMKIGSKTGGFWAERVEQGTGTFSIKDALLKSKKAKVGKDGIRYVIVPFPTATPRKVSSGKGASHFGGREMSEEAHAILKSGGKFSGALKSGGNTFGSGLVAFNTEKYHEAYGMFVCVNEKSKGWQYPGVASEPVFPKVLAEVDKQIAQVLSAYCSAIVKEFTQ